MRTIASLIITISAFAATVAANAIDYEAWSIENTKGSNYTAADGNFKTYGRPDGVTATDTPRFNVLVNQEAYTGLYCALNEWGGSGSFGVIDFRENTPIEVIVSARKAIGDFHVLPHDANVYDVEALGEKILKFKISKPEQQITIVSNGDYQAGDALHLFFNNVDDPEPAVDPEKKAAGGYFYDRATKTYYFGPGYYDLSKTHGGEISATVGRTVYIAGGAVLNGMITLAGEGASIKGHGIVMQSKDGAGSQLNVYNCTGGEVDGPVFFRYRIAGWQTTYTYSSNVTFRNMKVVCVYGGCTDGMDFQGCHDLTFDNCFVRAADDAIAVKGLCSGDPKDAPPEKNLSFNKVQIWSSGNGGFNLGAETTCYYENIKFTNCEVLYSFDGKGLNGSMDDRSALNICALHGTYFKDILYENIYVNRCERLIGVSFKDSFWYGTIQGDQTWPGDISGITYRNITCPYNTQGNISNDILFQGWHQEGTSEKYPNGTPDKFIHDVTFENVIVEGEPVLGWDNKHLITNNTDELQLVYDFTFKYESGVDDITVNREPEKDDIYYTIDGRIVKNPTRGIYPKFRSILV